MKIFEVTWFDITGWGAEINEERLFFYAPDELNLRSKLGLPMVKSSYESDPKKDKLFRIKEIEVIPWT